LSILMTETMIVKYSLVLYSFKFLTSLPKFRDKRNNIIQHHWWMRFPRKLHVNVFHDSRNEIRLRRCLCIRLFVYDLTSKHVPNKWATSFPGLFPFCHWEGGKRPWHRAVFYVFWLVNDKYIIMQIMQSWINLFKLWDKLTFSRKECPLLHCPSKKYFCQNLWQNG
jgi:hypothetical protein